MIIRSLDKNKLLDKEKDRDLSLSYLQQNQMNHYLEFLTSLHVLLLRIKKTNCLLEQKRSMIQHAGLLCDPLIKQLWMPTCNKIPLCLQFIEIYKEKSSVQKKEKSSVQTYEIIQYLLEIPDVLNNPCVWTSEEYDTYMTSIIDRIVSENTDENLLYNALPHLIRRNTRAANETIVNILNSHQEIRDKVSKVTHYTQISTSIDIKIIIQCAKKHNKNISNMILNMRLASSNDIKIEFAPDTDEPKVSPIYYEVNPPNSDTANSTMAFC